MRKMNASNRKSLGVILALFFALFLAGGCGGANYESLPSFPPLSRAAMLGDLIKVRALIWTGADLNEKDNDGDTALMAATRSGHIEIVKALFKADVPPSHRSMSNERIFGTLSA